LIEITPPQKILAAFQAAWRANSSELRPMTRPMRGDSISFFSPLTWNFILDYYFRAPSRASISERSSGLM
jgi:hypothetical protein